MYPFIHSALPPGALGFTFAPTRRIRAPARLGDAIDATQIEWDSRFRCVGYRILDWGGCTESTTISDSA